MPKRILQSGIIVDKQAETIVVKVKRRFTHPLLKNTVRRLKHYHAHDVANVYKVGDLVSIEETRPISKLKRWSVVRADAMAEISDPSSQSSDVRLAMQARKRRPTESAANANSAQISELKNSFNKLLMIKDTDLRTVELVISRLMLVEMGEAGKPIQELLDEDNRRSRDRFIAELAPLRRDDVLRLAQRIDPDGEAVLSRWEADGLVFSVTHHGKVYYPEFQFRDGLPRLMVKAVLDALPPELSDWQRAFWFMSANGWVHDEAPAAHLDDPALVVEAARHEGEPVIG